MSERFREKGVPAALRGWFLFHCAVDLLIALPLFVAPRALLEIFGWIDIDPFAARLTAAALFGIGIQSFLGRDEERSTYSGMLQLKLIWSAFATLGLVWSTLEGNLRYPIVGWLLAGVFAAFHLVWWYWWLQLQTSSRRP